MTPPELLQLLQEFYRDTLELVQDRQVNARSVADYNANNAYQQVLGRQDEHLSWLADAVAALGGAASSPGQSQDAAVTSSQGNVTLLIEADERQQSAFLERWAPRVRAVTNARHRKVLELILGEMGEHLRIIQQALAGQADLMGRSTPGKVLRGTVMATRPRN